MIIINLSPIYFSGFKCFKSYFETVNISEHRIHRNGPTIIVDKQDLVGLSYLWQLLLESPYPNIAEEATKYLISVSFTSLSSKLKKVSMVPSGQNRHKTV